MFQAHDASPIPVYCAASAAGLSALVGPVAASAASKAARRRSATVATHGSLRIVRWSPAMSWIYASPVSSRSMPTRSICCELPVRTSRVGPPYGCGRYACPSRREWAKKRPTCREPLRLTRPIVINSRRCLAQLPGVRREPPDEPAGSGGVRLQDDAAPQSGARRAVHGRVEEDEQRDALSRCSQLLCDLVRHQSAERVAADEVRTAGLNAAQGTCVACSRALDGSISRGPPVEPAGNERVGRALEARCQMPQLHEQPSATRHAEERRPCPGSRDGHRGRMVPVSRRDGAQALRSSALREGRPASAGRRGVLDREQKRVYRPCVESERRRRRP